MKYNKIVLALACLSSPLYANTDQQLLHEIQRLQHQTRDLQAQIDHLQNKMSDHKTEHRTQVVKVKSAPKRPGPKSPKVRHTHVHKKFYTTHLTVHSPEMHPESIGFYPTALIADDRVVTYIAGTPVVSSPYLGDRPAFDGSDYIVNISSINRDIRLMQQRRRLYRAYQSIGYPVPQMPIIALSGKAEPVGVINGGYSGDMNADFTLGSSELDVAAVLNQNVEAYIGMAYDESPPAIGPRINNSAFNLNMGFVNIGNLDRTPLYFTAGQLYVPFGRFSSAMISAPITMNLARTKTRPFIFGYKSQEEQGVFAAVYGYRSDTTLGKSGVGGANLGYIFKYGEDNGEIGVSFISSLNDAAGMQSTGSPVNTTFGGFGSFTNGNEMVRKTKAMDAHLILGYQRYNLTAEWAGVVQAFRPQDLSFNGRAARPQAVQGELGMTFRSFNRPSSIGVGYQWSSQALALNLPKQRYVAVYNISIWKDTVESLEYRHDIDYSVNSFANGAAPIGAVNMNTVGTGRSANTVSLQIGVYF
ncbi:MAG: LbtU family siderophore porin [Legionella sp.]|nr:MAG: LbtU family siderophore porin [Legionella sp.]